MFAKDKMLFRGVMQRTLGVAIVLGLLAWLMVGCTSTVNESGSSNAITADDLIIPESILPKGWKHTFKPQPLGPYMGFGNEKDRWIQFGLASDHPKNPDHLASQYILRLKDEKEAKYWYSAEADVYFGQDLVRDIPLFPSQFTSNLRVGCKDSARPNHIHCALLGQYDEFVIVMNGVIPREYITPEEFYEFARRIDRFIGERLAQR